MNVVYAVSGAAIACTVGLATYHELPPLQADPAPAETVAVKTNPEPPASHPVRTIPIVASPLVAPAANPIVSYPVATVAPAPPQASPVGAVPAAPAGVAAKPKERAGDVCARHGGQRVDDPARRSWRCVFPKRSAR